MGHHRLLRLLSLFAGVACADDTDTTRGEKTETRTVVTPITPREITVCTLPDGFIGQLVGSSEPLSFRVQASFVTWDCRCEHTTEGCHGERRCSTEYELGGPFNTSTCTTLDEGALHVIDATVKVDRGCSGAARIADAEAGIVEVTVVCATRKGPTLAELRIIGEQGNAELSTVLFVASDGKCPEAS